MNTNTRPRFTLARRISEVQAAELAERAAERAMDAWLRRVTQPGR